MTHQVFCDRCHKPTGSSSFEDIGEEKGVDVGGIAKEEKRKKKRFWWCKSCRFEARRCVICRNGVRGVWWGCGKCRHGGHQACLRDHYCEWRREFIDTSPVVSLGRRETRLLTGMRNEALMRPSVNSTVLSRRDTRMHDSLRPTAHTSQSQSTLVPISSQTSVGIDTSAPRTSGETARSTDLGYSNSGLAEGWGWSACPSGCGCRCRVIRVTEGERDDGPGEGQDDGELGVI